MMVKDKNKKIVDIKATLISDSDVYAGRIENLSEKDLYVLASPALAPEAMQPGSEVTLQMFLDSGENINVSGRVKWAYRTPPYGASHSIGIEIKHPLSRYKEIFQSL